MPTVTGHTGIVWSGDPVQGSRGQISKLSAPKNVSVYLIQFSCLRYIFQHYCVNGI